MKKLMPVDKVAEEQSCTLNDNLKKMLDKGTPVWRADFHSAINNSDDVPENYFSSESHVPSRNVKMWWVPAEGLICLHKGEYFIVPASTVKFAKFL